MLHLFLEGTTTPTPAPETSNSNIQDFFMQIWTWLTHYGLKLIFALILLFIYFKLINFIIKKIRNKLLEKKKVDETVTISLFKVLKFVLKAVGVLIFLGYIGFDTAGIGTIIGSIGIALGLALQGSLSNLAGGVVILIMRPFKLGDFIEAQGYSGTVREIHTFYTYIDTPDNKVVMIPNGVLANGNIVNYSKNPLRRVDLTFSIGYDDNAAVAMKTIEKIVDKHELVLHDKDVTIRVGELASSSVDIVCKAWTKNENYWTVKFDLIERVKAEFDKLGISIPFNQLDVHLNPEATKVVKKVSEPKTKTTAKVVKKTKATKLEAPKEVIKLKKVD